MKRPDLIIRNKSRKQRLAVSRSWLDPEKSKLRKERISKAVTPTLYGTKRHLGCKHSEEAKAKIREARKKQVGENHPGWKGDSVGYVALHDWVKSRRGTAIRCAKCGRTSIDMMIEWVNIDHRYNRNLDDFVSLCRSCHRKHDIANNGYTTHFMRRAEVSHA